MTATSRAIVMGGCFHYYFYSTSSVSVASFSCPRRPVTLPPSHERTRQRQQRRQWVVLRQQLDNDEILQQQFFGVGSSESFAADYSYVDDEISTSISYSSPLSYAEAASPIEIAIESYLDDQSSDNSISIPISISNNELLNNNSIQASVSVVSSKDEMTTVSLNSFNNIDDSSGTSKAKRDIAVSENATLDTSSVTRVKTNGITNKTSDDIKARFEKDVQLTRHVILRHIEQVCVDDYIDDEDNDVNLQHNNNNNAAASAASVTAPTISRILQYTLPAIGIWLCSPVLSMIDTAAVGLLAGTAQQAALNPAIVVSDYGAIVVAFMYTATTNLVAAAVREDKDDAAAAAAQNVNNDVNLQQLLHKSQPKTITTVLTAMKLATIVGTFFSILLYTLGPILLQLLIGTNAATSTTTTTIINPIVYNSAKQYVKIRALGMPAMVMIGTAQSACLGMQDVRSPLLVLLAAAIINFFGDVILVPLKSSVLGGAAGAAWATVASQYAALIFFARWWLLKTNDDNTAAATTTTTTAGSAAWWAKLSLFRKMNKTTNSKVDGIRRRSITTSQMTSTVTTTSTRGILSDSKLKLRSYLSLKNINISKVHEFLPFVIPVTTTSVSRISGYIAMSHVASSTLGTIDLAGHQIILSIFGCITPFVDALSQVAQSLVPGIFASYGHGQQNTGRKERAIALQQTVTNFRIVGLGAGVVLVGLISCVPLVSQYFTTNAVVLERVHGAIKPVSLFLLVNGLMCAGEGKKMIAGNWGLFRFVVNHANNTLTFAIYTTFTYMLCDNKKEHCSDRKIYSFYATCILCSSSLFQPTCYD